MLLLLQGLDIGPDSLKAFQDSLSDCKTIVWNGPMGVFEFEKFAKGTFGVADTLAGTLRHPSALVAAHLWKVKDIVGCMSMWINSSF